MELYKTFRDCFTHLGNLFVATGGPELSSKMVSYTMNQKVFIKGFYSSEVFMLLFAV